ncbi:MAG: hypothetical protein HQL99_13795 [Magnetococcales bacterium]|nr:hypothetical protein [Magnetococcales bacterium]
MLPSVQPRAWGRDATRLSSSGDAEAGKSGEARLHFRDFLSPTNSRQDPVESEERRSALMNGSPAELAALNRTPASLANPQGEPPEAAALSPDSDPEPWTLMAPTVNPPRPRSTLTGNAAFRIYARAAHPLAEPVQANVSADERNNEEFRR